MRLNGPPNKPRKHQSEDVKTQAGTNSDGLSRDGRKVAPAPPDRPPSDKKPAQQKTHDDKPRSVNVEPSEGHESGSKDDLEKPVDWLAQVRGSVEQANSDTALQALLDECRQQGRDLHPIHTLVDDKAMSLLQAELDSLDDRADMVAAVTRYRKLIKAPRKRRRADHLPDQLINLRKMREHLHGRLNRANEQTGDYGTTDDRSWQACHQNLEQLLNEKEEVIGQTPTLSERDDDDDIVIGGPTGNNDLDGNSISESFAKNNPAYDQRHIQLQNMKKYGFSASVDDLCEEGCFDEADFLNEVTYLLDAYIANNTNPDYDDVTLTRLQALVSQGKKVVVDPVKYRNLEQNIIQAAVTLTRNAIKTLNDAEVLLGMKSTFETMLFQSSLNHNDRWNNFTMFDQALSQRFQEMGVKTGWQADFQRFFCRSGRTIVIHETVVRGWQQYA